MSKATTQLHEPGPNPCGLADPPTELPVAEKERDEGFACGPSKGGRPGVMMIGGYGLA